MAALRPRQALLAQARRLLYWLIPEHAVVSEVERRAQMSSIVAAWIGAVGLALTLTLAEMGLDLVAKDAAREFLRPFTFMLVTLTCTALVMRVSFRQSGKFYAEQAILNRALEHQAQFDGLTDLPNRRQFHDRLLRSLDKTPGGDPPSFALLTVDLDGFKDINDTLGHAVGDLLLQETARRLQAVLRPQDLVARVGGDEFIAILAGRSDRAEQVAVRLLDAVAAPVPIDDHVVQVTASVGIACYPAHGSTDDLLLRRGDLAMYAAKRSGGTYAVYSPALEPTDYPVAA